MDVTDLTKSDDSDDETVIEEKTGSPVFVSSGSEASLSEW